MSNDYSSVMKNTLLTWQKCRFGMTYPTHHSDRASPSSDCSIHYLSSRRKPCSLLNKSAHTATLGYFHAYICKGRSRAQIKHNCKVSVYYQTRCKKKRFTIPGSTVRCTGRNVVLALRSGGVDLAGAFTLQRSNRSITSFNGLNKSVGKVLKDFSVS